MTSRTCAVCQGTIGNPKHGHGTTYRGPYYCECGAGFCYVQSLHAHQRKRSCGEFLLKHIECSLCGQKLPKDDLEENRRARHQEYHTYSKGRASRNIHIGIVQWRRVE